MIKNMLLQIHRRGIFPMRQSGQRKIDDAIERRLDVGERQVVTVEIFGEGTRPGRRLADQQPRHVLRAGLGFGNEKSQVQQRQLAHGDPFLMCVQEPHFAALRVGGLEGNPL